MYLSDYIINNAIICACALVGFLIGAAIFFRPRKAVYGQMIALGLGCLAAGRLYQIVKVLTGGDVMNLFQMGSLGELGSFLFFFSANFGLMDSLADDGTKRFRKYRWTATIAPIIATAFGLLFCVNESVSLLNSITSSLLVLGIICTSYYNLKHILLPDVDFGIINCLKLSNGAILAYCALSLAERAAYIHQLYGLLRPISIAIGVVILLIVPFVAWGYKKWTT